MKTIVIHELRFGRKNLIIWLSVMLLLAGLGAAEYSTVAGDVSIAPLIAGMPRLMSTIFGVYDGIPIDDISGYYACMFLWYCLVAYPHAAVIGATIIAKEEDCHTAEYLFTKPFTRNKIITAKLFAALFNLAAMSALTWFLTAFALLPQASQNISAIVTQTMLGMILTQFLFLGIGLLCSSLFRKKQTAVSLSVFLVLLFYLISVIIEFFGVSSLTILTPFWYFGAPTIIRSGFPVFYLLPTALLSGICITLTYRLYGKRDLYC